LDFAVRIGNLFQSQGYDFNSCRGNPAPERSRRVVARLKGGHAGPPRQDFYEMKCYPSAARLDFYRGFTIEIRIWKTRYKIF
jgi:hypothetical protein